MPKSLLVLSVLTLAAAFGQLQDNRDKQLDCNNNRNGDRRHAYKCNLTEQTIASVGTLTVDPGKNGGVTVKGWTNRDILVRVMMTAWAPTDSEASAILAQVHSDAAAGKVTATGPESHDDSYWSVSYEIFVPQMQELKVSSVNGGIRVSDISGRLDLGTKNGGVHLTRVIGDVTAKTTNGGIRADLEGANWQGRQLDLETTNGGVQVTAPNTFQAHVQAHTVNGAIRSEFATPATQQAQDVRGRQRAQSLEFDLGGGGATVKLSTTNGAIRLNRAGGPERKI